MAQDQERQRGANQDDVRELLRDRHPEGEITDEVEREKDDARDRVIEVDRAEKIPALTLVAKTAVLAEPAPVDESSEGLALSADGAAAADRTFEALTRSRRRRDLDRIYRFGTFHPYSSLSSSIHSRLAAGRRDLSFSRRPSVLDFHVAIDRIVFRLAIGCPRSTPPSLERSTESVSIVVCGENALLCPKSTVGSSE